VKSINNIIYKHYLQQAVLKRPSVFEKEERIQSHDLANLYELVKKNFKNTLSSCLNLKTKGSQNA
jgi:hypothetical protein